MSGRKEDKGSARKNQALFTLAGTVVTTLGAIATHETTAVLVPLITVAAILFVFTLLLWHQGRQERVDSAPHLRAKDLHPERLAKRVNEKQRREIGILLDGAVGDIAGEIGVQPRYLRANLFSCFPKSNQLGMVKDLWRNMDGGEECTIRMTIGEGSAGIAWATGNSNKVVRNGDWGESQISDPAELDKVHPDLRWILTVPIFGSDATTKLVLNVDGLRPPTQEHRLDAAMGHLPRFGHGISGVLGL